MENARSQDGVSLALDEDFGHVCSNVPAPPLAALATGIAHRFTHAPRNGQIKSSSGSVRVNRVQNNFPRRRARRLCAPNPPRPFLSLFKAVRKHFPFVRYYMLGINGNHDALASKFFRPGPNQIWIGQRGGELMRSCPRLARSMIEHVIHRFDPAHR